MSKRWAAVWGALLLLTLSVSPVLADESSITFSISQIGTDEARESTLSYAPNGTIWYSGMSTELTGEQANLWWTTTDTAAFAQESDPPPSGGADAVVHHDSDGRMFFAESVRPTRVSVRLNNAWLPVSPGSLNTVTEIPNADRPWLRTVSDGTTYLAVLNQSDLQNPDDDHLEVWKNKTGTYGWTLDTANVTGPAALADFANDTNQKLYLLLRRYDGTGYGLASRPSGSVDWTLSSRFAINFDGGFGIARLAVDLANRVYVIYGSKEGTNDYGIWLRLYNPGDDSWSSAFRISGSGRTGAVAGAAAGAEGVLGVSWYEASGNFYPSEAPLDKKWDVNYVVIENAHTSPSFAESPVSLKTAAHQGPLTGGGGGPGDLSFVLRRQGDSAGKVAVAFACDDALQSACIATLQPWPKPFYAVQTAGRGLLE